MDEILGSAESSLVSETGSSQNGIAGASISTKRTNQSNLYSFYSKTASHLSLMYITAHPPFSS